MKRIYKCRLCTLETINDILGVDMPIGAELLHVQFRDSELNIWALVDTDVPVERRVFRLYGTGFQVDSQDGPWNYAGTIHDKKDFVWHIFDERRTTNPVEP